MSVQKEDSVNIATPPENRSVHNVRI